MADTEHYGWTKPTVGASSDTWGTTLNALADDIDADLKNVSDASKSASNLSSGTVPAARGGAGTVSGLLKANGSGAVSQAVSGTDYAPATSGGAILYGDGSGGFSNVTIGTTMQFSGGILSVKQTISTSAPSGTPTDGETWLQYSA